MQRNVFLLLNLSTFIVVGKLPTESDEAKTLTLYL